MRLPRLLGLLPAATNAMASSCDALASRDYEHYSSASGLLLGDGDIDEGRVVYVKLSCHSCHAVERISFSTPSSPLSERIQIEGEVAELPMDGYLATSIINPEHELAEGYAREIITDDGVSRMTDYGDLLTVRELKDVVAFPHSQHRLAEQS